MPRPLLISGTYAALAHATATRLHQARKERDLASLLAEPASVIVPSRAAADAIVANLLELSPEGITAIRLRNLDTWALDLLNANGRFPRVAGDRERRIALEAAIESAPDTRLRRPSFAPMLERSYRDLRDSGVSVAQFRDEIRRFRRDRDLARTSADIWSAYEKKIAAVGAVDPASIFDDATALASTAAIGPQIVFGFYDMTGVQRRLVDRLVQRGLVEAIYFPAVADDSGPSKPYRFSSPLYDHFAAACETTLAIPDHDAPRVTIRESATRHDELRAICSDVRRLLDSGVSPHSIGIATRTIDPREGPVLQHIAAGYGFRVTTRTSMPLTAHRLGQMLATLLGVADRGFPRAEVLELLGSRAKRRLFGDVDVFPIERATRKWEIAGGTPAALRAMLPRVEREEDVPAVHAYIDAVERLSRLTSPYARMSDAGAWADELAQAAAMFDSEDARDLAALDAVDEIVRLLGNAAAMRRTLTVNDVLHLLEDATLPASATDDDLPDVWFGDAMSFRGRSFEHLFLFAVEQDTFPQTRSDDLLFTNDMRRKIAVREIDDGRDEERLLFQILLDGARDVRLSFAGSSIDLRPRRPSQLLKEFAIDRDPASRSMILRDFVAWVRSVAPAPPLVASRDESRAAEILRGDSEIPPALLQRLRIFARRGDDSEYDGFLTVTPPLAARIGEKISRISATEFERFGECPQNFLLRTVYGLQEVEEPELEIAIESRKKGTLYHRVLETFYRSLTIDDYATLASGDPIVLTPDIAARLGRIVDDEFDEHERLYPSPNETIRAMERRIAHRTITNFLLEDLRFTVDSGLRPRWFEYRFGASSRSLAPPDTEAVPIAVGEHTLTIRGSIDRLDTNAAKDAFRIIDYKSGTASHLEKLTENIRAGRHLQLALYALVVSKIFNVPPGAVDGYARSISKPSASDSKFSFRLGEIHEFLLHTLTSYVDAIYEGKFPALPRDEKTCDFCVAALWCRTRHDAEEKRGLESMKTVAERLGATSETAS